MTPNRWRTMGGMPARTPSPFGALLRQWRTRQGLSQLDLALSAEVSARHLGFVETGRASPSREMVLLLARALDIPLRECNRLLSAAGFNDHYRESDLDDPEMAKPRRALEFVLERHEPYPALVVDASWQVRLANHAAQRLIAWFVPPDALPVGQQPNLLRLLFDPRAARPYVVNWEEVASELVQRVHREAVARGPDSPAEEVLREVLDQPGVPASWRKADLLQPLSALDCLVLERDGLRLNLFSTIWTFGSPLDITFQELRVETYFPADDETEAALPRPLPAR
jgi:transcriptional regulator with XRE-family HTH domain